MLWHAYVDESGDRGWKRRSAAALPGTREGSSEHFSLTAVLVPDGAQTGLLAQWDRSAMAIGRQPSDTLHWVNVRSHSQRLYLAQMVGAMPDLRVCTVVFSKWDVPNVSAVRKSDYLYNWTLRLLVERLSWFGKREGVEVAMHFAQVKGLPPDVIARYLAGLRGQKTNIEWQALKTPAKVNTPKNQRMLQIADTASGAVYAAFEWDEYGNVEGRYLQALRARLWRPSGAALHVYGLKVAPYPHPRHAWLPDFCKA